MDGRWMDWLVLNSCCCCGYGDLKIASFAIAYIHLVAVVILSTALVVGTIFIEETKALLDKSQQGLLPTIEPTEEIMLGLLILLLPFLFGLLLGLHKNLRIYVKAYLMASSLFIFLDIGMFCMSFVYRYSVGVVVFRVLYIILEIYFLVVVRSYYYKMR